MNKRTPPKVISGGDNPYDIHDAKLSSSATAHESSSVTGHEISNIFTKETGTANQGNLGSEDIKKIVYIPLPPLAEQKRIVAKIEQLLPLCDRLKFNSN